MRRVQQKPLTVAGCRLSDFLVLTVCPDERGFEPEARGRRIALLQGEVRRLDGKQKSYRAFWLTTQDRFDWQQPHSILQNIWQTPREGECVSLLDIRS